MTMPRMRRIDCSGPGITRRRRGRGFEFIDLEGRRVEEAEITGRIRELAIPPAWNDVWICPYPNGHLQAVGTDAAERKQYIYHKDWRRRQDQEKFDEMLEFARALPQVRETCAAHLEAGGLGRERVLSAAIRLLDYGYFRIGTEGYAEQNQTYGLATIEKRHVRLRDDLMVFDYVAKSGKRRVRPLRDSETYDVVAALKRRRGGGEGLLAYKRGRTWIDVKSSDINQFVKEITGQDFSAKDFRTWPATVVAAIGVAVSGHTATTKTARKRAITHAITEVAHYMGNTPAVCRASYIDPRVFDRYLSGWTIHPILERLGEDAVFGQPSFHGPVEEGVIDLIENNRASPAIEKSRAAS